MTPEQIAKGLTKAQREILLWHCPYGGERENPGPRTGGAIKALNVKGLSVARYDKYSKGTLVAHRRLTPLGLAVRAHLAAEDRP